MFCASDFGNHCDVIMIIIDDVRLSTQLIRMQEHAQH